MATCNSDQAALYRFQFLSRSPEYRGRQLAEQLAADLPGSTVSDAKLIDLDDLNKPVRIEYALRLPHQVRRIGELLLFRVPWADRAVATGPFVAQSRTQPLAAPRSYTHFERHEFAIPGGYRGYGLPFDAHARCPWAEYWCSVRLASLRLVCERKMVYKGGIIPAAEFPEFKRFWETCARADEADMILMAEGGMGTLV